MNSEIIPLKRVSTPRQGSGRSPAKLILMGEHFVVYGSPALAIPVPALMLSVRAYQLGPSMSIPVRTEVTATARERPGVESIPASSHLLSCRDLACARLGLDPDELGISVESSIPVGAGLGSSAALSVAMARALAALAGLAGDTETDHLVRSISLDAEKLAHGRPSGVDTEVCLTERPLLFSTHQKPSPLSEKKPSRLGFLVLDTGESASTAEMVERVAGFRRASFARFESLQAETSECVTQAAFALERGDHHDLGRFLGLQQQRLDEIGVSTPSLERLVEQALDAGASGAKLSGSGGGGVVVAVCSISDMEKVRGRLRDRAIAAFGL